MRGDLTFGVPPSLETDPDQGHRGWERDDSGVRHNQLTKLRTQTVCLQTLHFQSPTLVGRNAGTEVLVAVHESPRVTYTPYLVPHTFSTLTVVAENVLRKRRVPGGES